MRMLITAVSVEALANAGVTNVSRPAKPVLRPIDPVTEVILIGMVSKI